MSDVKFIPVLMRDDSGEVVKVANAAFSESRGTFRFRVDLDTLHGEHFIFGKSLEMGLVEALQIRVVASDLGIETVAAVDPAVVDEIAEVPET